MSCRNPRPSNPRGWRLPIRLSVSLGIPPTLSLSFSCAFLHDFDEIAKRRRVHGLWMYEKYRSAAGAGTWGRVYYVHSFLFQVVECFVNVRNAQGDVGKSAASAVPFHLLGHR